VIQYRGQRHKGRPESWLSTFEALPLRASKGPENILSQGEGFSGDHAGLVIYLVILEKRTG
jgi:hypothetical protein